MGEQWHPEYLPQRREQRAIFRALVRAAKERMAVG
jgi:putative glutamine amidotransferase